MISYLGSLVQFSPAAGRAGHCRQMSLCVGSTHRVLARQPEVLAASLRLRRAFSPPRGAAQAARGSGALSPGRGASFPSAASGPGSQRLARTLPGCGAPFPSVAPARAAGRVSGSLQIGPGPVCRVGGDGFSGAEFAPFPSPLPPTSSGDGAALLRSFSVPLFYEPPAVCSAGQFFSRSPTV